MIENAFKVCLAFFLLNYSWMGVHGLAVNAQGYPGGYPPRPSQGLENKLSEYCWRLQTVYSQGPDFQFGYNQCINMLSWKAHGLRQQLSSLGYPSIEYFCQAYFQNGFGYESACPDELAVSLARGQWVGNLGPFIGYLNQRRPSYVLGPSAPVGGGHLSGTMPTTNARSVPGAYECRLRSTDENEYQNCLGYQQLGTALGTLFQQLFK